MDEHRILPPLPSFPAFYRAINRRNPFPWQARLAEQIGGREEWPDEIGVPTGLGKTACLDIAVWWLASQADRTPSRRTAPTRIWWVVNRRILVDSTAEHADAIQEALQSSRPPKSSAEDARTLNAVGERLRSLSASGNPLEVIRLRGGFSSGTPRDPSQPAIILSTLPMYGSRLLFRGYGVSRSMRPVEAAMAGTDCLVLLDEAHLAPHLRALLPALEECAPDAEPLLGVARSRPRLVSLTATGDPAGTSRFDLDDADETNEVVRQRLDSVKPVELRISKGGPERALATATVQLLETAPAPAACLVFANTPATGRAVFELLGKEKWKGESPDLLLLTGRSREWEAERIRKRILDPDGGLPAGRDRVQARRKHLIVVATQTLEVGADLDADYLVTEGCGVRALTQRLGRLNRLGLCPYARAVYVHVPPPKPKRRSPQPAKSTDEWPVYGCEPATVMNRLQEARLKDGTETVNLSPRRVRSLLGVPNDDSGRAPEILSGLLWEWIKTTTPPLGEAPVEPYFAGISRPDLSVSLIWRVHLPEDGERLWPRARDYEAVEIPIGEAKAAFADNTEVRRLAADGVTAERVAISQLRPGDRIVLPSDGLLDEFGWNPSSICPVRDVSLAEAGLPLHPEALRRLCGLSIANLLTTALGEGEGDEPIDPSERSAALEVILERANSIPDPPHGWEADEWRAFLESLSRRIVAPRNEVARLSVPRATPEARSDEYDEMSLGPDAVELARHGQAVAERAKAIADRMGLRGEVTAVVRQAALLHDIGKADARFQRWLDPSGESPIPVAKSSMPRRQWSDARTDAGWPAGGRHEDLSARLVARWLEQHSGWAEPLLRDLLLHLVISHHGKGRPLVPPVTDGAAASVSAQIEGVSVEAPADLGLVDWSQPARFHRLNQSFGPWGLALLEAVVRRADHSVSAATDAGPVEVQ